MRFITSILASVSIFVLAQAQNLAPPPDCAIACFRDTVSVAGCGAEDVYCLCRSIAFPKAVSNCIVESCPSDNDKLSAVAFGNAACASVGVTEGRQPSPMNNPPPAVMAQNMKSNVVLVTSAATKLTTSAFLIGSITLVAFVTLA